jgi:hypothetical protein
MEFSNFNATLLDFGLFDEIIYILHHSNIQTMAKPFPWFCTILIDFQYIEE